jgi:hypothetical protein
VWMQVVRARKLSVHLGRTSRNRFRSSEFCSFCYNTPTLPSLSSDNQCLCIRSRVWSTRIQRAGIQGSPALSLISQSGKILGGHFIERHSNRTSSHASFKPILVMFGYNLRKLDMGCGYKFPSAQLFQKNTKPQPISNFCNSKKECSSKRRNQC